jgi:hypothetical protein
MIGPLTDHLSYYINPVIIKFIVIEQRGWIGTEWGLRCLSQGCRQVILLINSHLLDPWTTYVLMSPNCRYIALHRFCRFCRFVAITASSNGDRHVTTTQIDIT